MWCIVWPCAETTSFNCSLHVVFCRHAVCVFYLVLRALDTVEDDMTIPNEKKIPMLKEFYKYLYDPDWKFLNSKEKDKIVLEDFLSVSRNH